jgi:hypothetical protein
MLCSWSLDPVTKQNHSDRLKLPSQPISKTRLRASTLCAASLGAFLFASSSFPSVGVAQNVTTEQYGNARSGVQSQETVLTPSNVNSASFGKLFSLPVSGHVYAQPLYMAGLTMADGKTHNVLFVATEEDYLYAFDADGNNPTQGYLWRDLLLGTGETVVSYIDVNSGDIYPDIGITSTPVIDPSTGTIYVVAKSKTISTPVTFLQRIHALNLADGTEKLNGPTVIQATVPGSSGGGATISFNPLLGNQRAGLLLAPTPNGSVPASVFIAWASHGDNGAYHGWVISYNAADISQQTGAWSDTPNGSQGGIWQAGGGLSSDGNGNIFAASGNGTFDANTGGLDYGDSAVSLTLSGTTLAPTSFFAPAAQNSLDVNDNDMGTSAVVLLPTQSAAIPHLAVTADKSGKLYLLNVDSLGGYSASEDASVQSFNIGYSILTSPAFFNNTLYLAGEGGPLSAWAFNPSTERLSIAPTTSSPTTYGCNDCGGAGTTPVISANGTSNAIVWALNNSGRENSPAILNAYDPLNLQHVLYGSNQAANNRDVAAIAVKFTSPVVVNGHVYVGGVNAVTAYGVIATTPTVSISATPPSIAPGGSSTLSVNGTNATAITVTGTDGSSFTLSPTGGTKTVTPAATTTYTATATGGSGNLTATATVTLTVTSAASGCLPSTPGVSICAPANSATTGSTVTVTAGALAQTGNISAIRAYIDNVAAFTVNNSSATKSFQVTQTADVTPGSHNLVIVGYQSTGGSVQSSRLFTASGATSCTPAAVGAIICSPAKNATVSSPVQILAGATTSGRYITAIRVYVDNIAQTTVDNPHQSLSFSINQPISMKAGTHNVVVVCYLSTGGALDASETITVQ